MHGMMYAYWIVHRMSEELGQRVAVVQLLHVCRTYTCLDAVQDHPTLVTRTNTSIEELARTRACVFYLSEGHPLIAEHHLLGGTQRQREGLTRSSHDDAEHCIMCFESGLLLWTGDQGTATCEHRFC